MSVTTDTVAVELSFLWVLYVMWCEVVLQVRVPSFFLYM